MKVQDVKEKQATAKKFDPSISTLFPVGNYLFIEEQKVDVLHQAVSKESVIKGSGDFELILAEDEEEAAIKASQLTMSFGKKVAIATEAQEELGVNEGDIVGFGILAGRDATIQGKDYRVLRSTDIVTIVSKSAWK